MVTTIASGAAGIAAGLPNRRLKKLGFKQLLSIQRGSSALAGATESAIENEDSQDKGLGVDASEISEHHLQAALSSSQVAADALANVQANGNGAGSAPAKVSYHIPTPDAKAVLMQREYHDLYKLGAYSDPVTYIRTSKTVEESVRGPSYILDEDDNEWLEDRNKKAGEAIATALRSFRPPSSAKGKNKEKSREEMAASLARENVDLKVITQDEFEMVITVFEQVTSDKVPFAHLDLSKLPTLDDLLPSFDEDSDVSKLAFPELPELAWESQSSSSSFKSHQEWSPENPYRNLPALKNVAKVVYPWWKNRREDREGKAIMPALNFDESNDNDPYVCFRRREVKMIRKTRKTDAMHLEKLVRLRHELQQSVSLLSLLAQREKTKRATLVQDKACWQSTRELLEVKKQWNIAGPNNGLEDEELISGEKRDEHAHGVAGVVAINISSKKKRKADDAATSIASIKEGGVVKIPNRKARPSNGEESAAAAGTASAGQATAANGAASSTASTGLGSAILDRVQAVQAYIEREVQRKSDSDLGWEEGSDAAFQPMPVPSHMRSFRPIHLDSQSDSSEMPSFPWSSNSPSNANNFGRVGRPASFRRRVGRGGRIFLDRRLPAPSPVPSSLSDWPRNGANVESVSKSEQKGKEKQSDEAGKEGKESSTEKQNEVNKTSQSQTSNDSRLKSQGKDQLPELLTGPFAFSASIRPSQLSSSPAVSRTMQTGPFASSPLKQQNIDNIDGGASDASSSTSSQHSKVSTSTKATSLDENEESVVPHKENRREQNSDDEMAGMDEDDDDNGSIASEDEVERWTRIRERWRYDDETGRWAGLGLCGLGGMEDDDEAIIDDFDQRFMRFRMNLLEEADLNKLSTDLSNVMQAQAAADTPTTIPAGYSIYRGDSSNVYSQAQQQQAAQAQQAQAQVQAQQHAQQQAAAQAAALGHPNALARAAQTNVGGPLAALQQQQPIQQAQLQLALQQQQQQRAVQAQAQALANAAAAAAASANQQGGQQQQSGAAQHGHQQQGSPNVRAPNGQQPNVQVNGQTSQLPPHSAAQAIAHPLAQSFGGVQGLPNQAAVNGAAAAMAAGRFGPNNAHAANLLAQFASGLGGNLSANAMSSPQMQNQLNRPLSSSPVPQAQGQQQQRSSPHIGSNGSYHSSPAQGHAMPVGAQQGQQRMNGNNINLLNGAGANQMPQMNPLQAAAAIQQAQAALQAQQNMQQQQANGQQQQQLQTQPQPQFTSQQLMAMQAALTQNVNMQLKLPQNRNRNMQLAQAQQQLAAVTAAAQASANKGVNGINGQQQQTHLNMGVGQQGQGQQQLSQAQIGMGLLQNLQQQINFAQQNQQHNPGLNAALNAATASMGPNANGLLAALSQQVNSSPQSKGRT